MARKEKLDVPPKAKEFAEIAVKPLDKLSPKKRAVRSKELRIAVGVSGSQRGRRNASEAIEAKLQSLAANVPESEWRKLPGDLTEDLDHYLYGTPRK